MTRVLNVHDLSVSFRIDDRYHQAVHGVDLYLEEGETLGLVGESGCGKSVTSLAIMRLLQDRTQVTGHVDYNGKELLALTDKQMQAVRGNEIAMIFQEPMTSLNPLLKIGDQIAESLWLHQKMNRRAAMHKVVELLQRVGISRAEQVVTEYPHQLSGGMRQRVMIAIAMACNPAILIADEPTTALDVTIQAQILDLIREVTSERNMSTLLITHDLGVVAEMCDRVAVMYAGRIVEQGTVRQIFKSPQHPYTVGLLNSIPKLNGVRGKLYSISGNVPSLRKMPHGCPFAPRCEHVMDTCRQEEPMLVEVEPEHQSRCWLQTNGKASERIV